MATLRVMEERTIAAPSETVYAYIANYREHHPRFLPPAFTNLQVEQGGIGAGTIISFQAKAGGRTRRHRMRVAEPEPGRVLTEAEIDASLFTTFTVTPEGNQSRVRIETTWQGATGMEGLIERLLAPRMLRNIFADELSRLDRYAREQETD